MQTFFYYLGIATACSTLLVCIIILRTWHRHRHNDDDHIYWDDGRF